MSLSLTCTAFAVTTRPIRIYSIVVLSRLIQDRKEFEKHLKDHRNRIQEVVWHGLDLESLMRDPVMWKSLLRQACMSSVVASVVRDPNLLWMPVEPVDPSYENMCRVSADWISEQFESLPNMTTLTIKPMPDTRAFGFDMRKDVKPGHIENPNGQFDFLVALSALSQPWSKVRTLNLDTRFPGSDVWRAPLEDSPAFRYLTTINICVVPKRKEYIWGSEYGTLVHFLQHARNLRSLKLCFLDVRYEEGPRESSDSAGFLNGLFSDYVKWPHLHSLHIVNVPHLSRTFLVADPLERLRHLTLDNCDVTSQDLKWLRRGRELSQLESITIRSRRFSSDYHLVTETRLLAFLANRVQGLGPGTRTGRIVTANTEVPLGNLCSFCTK
ncbi:hypothetical protein F4680DRAFT_470069 [Xylaria scruposa]|nr:hypothetical protein F4680DRAFT_470069 [Xylaria scruposa]